ncbi:hypothetical protein QL996_15310 [Planococcus sp. APC 4015]|nr:hypothetical protein [Planococcus sp. APC 4015]
MTGAVREVHRSTATPTVRARVTRDSLWLSSAYAVTTGSGFVFWLLAALWIPQAQLGVEASVLSVVMAAAALASNGPGSALVVMLPLGGRAARAALLRALLVSAGLALFFGAAAGVLAVLFLPIGMDLIEGVAVIAGCTVVWALFNTQTMALAGASDARGTLLVNGSANILKLALLFALIIPIDGMPHPLVTATMLPAAGAVVLSLFVLIPRALRREDARAGSDAPWDPALARTFRVFTAQNGVAVGVVLGAGLSLPFLVTALSTPAEGAIFAIAFPFSVALDLVGVAVATALARSASVDYSASAVLAKGYVTRIVLIVAVLGLAAALATPLMFLVLGRGYPPLYGMAVVACLAFASVIRPGYDIWSALMRARHRVRPVLWSNALYVAILFALVFALVPRVGALGAALAVGVAAVALAVIGITGLRRAPLPTALAVPEKEVLA